MLLYPIECYMGILYRICYYILYNRCYNIGCYYIGLVLPT